MRIKYLALVLLTGFASVEAAAQSAPPRMDIPAIAKAANGAIVSIVMSGKDGHALAQGSGFLVSKDGLIVTNYHVIAEGTSAVVKLPEGAFFVVDGVLASDKARDLAVIKAHGKSFRTLTLGNSDQVQVGEEVVAIGNPLSLESTVSNGIVSGIRTVEEEGGKFLQVTTPISPGSSGGPLFNMAGEVVGITTLFLKGGENLNFAIPINDAKRLLSNQSAVLRSLPDEAEEASKETQSFIRYRVMSYSPNKGVVTVRHGNQLFTAVVLFKGSKFCKVKVVVSIDYERNDCEEEYPIVAKLVGQELLSEKEAHSLARTTDKGGYIIEGVPNEERPDVFMVTEWRKDWMYPPGGAYTSHFHIEFWNIEKIEVIQP